MVRELSHISPVLRNRGRAGSLRLRGALISQTVVDAFAAAIQRQEGYFPGSLAYRNNNPGNLEWAGQTGGHAGAGGFAAFPSYDAGMQALKNQIVLDAERGHDAAGRPVLTVADLVRSWAPASDPRGNDTPAYIASVSRQTGYDPNALLSDLSGAPDYSIDVFLPAGDGAGFGSGAGTSAAGGVLVPDFPGSSLFDGQGLDLSAVGGSGSVPWLWIGAGAVGLVLLARRI